MEYFLTHGTKYFYFPEDRGATWRDQVTSVTISTLFAGFLISKLKLGVLETKQGKEVEFQCFDRTGRCYQHQQILPIILKRRRSHLSSGSSQARGRDDGISQFSRSSWERQLTQVQPLLMIR